MNTIDPYNEKRPWGEFTKFTQNTPSTVKIIVVHPHEALSLQYHHHRAEFWYVISGTGTAEINGEHITLSPGTTVSISPTVLHRVTADNVPLTFLEIATGDFDENDIVRTEDRYHRT